MGSYYSIGSPKWNLWGACAVSGPKAGGAHRPIWRSIRLEEGRYSIWGTTGGHVRLQKEKKSAITAYPCPKTKKAVRRSFGLAITRSSCQTQLTSPLTDLTQKVVTDKERSTALSSTSAGNCPRQRFQMQHGVEEVSNAMEPLQWLHCIKECQHPDHPVVSSPPTI